MKKAIAAVLSSVLSALLLIGCGGDSAPSGDVGSDTDSLKIAMLIPGNLGDMSFFDAAASSLPLLESGLGAETRLVEMGMDVTTWHPTFLDYCEQDFDLIITIADAVVDKLVEIAEMYPNQKFFNIDSSLSENIPDNIYVMVAKMGEMSFLAGLVAALKAEELGEDTIGFIGGMDIPGINEFLIGYIDGAQHINPDIKVAFSYVGDFSDPGRGKENALILYNSVPVIYQAAGGSGLGVFDAAKDFTARGLPRYAIGVDSDQAMELSESDPDAANLIITSAVKQIPEYTLNAVRRFIEGEIAFGTQSFVGLKENGVSIAKNSFYEQLLSAESRARVDDLESKLVSGELNAINTINMPTEEVEQIRNSVRP